MSRPTGFPLDVRIQIIHRAAGRCERCDRERPGCALHHRRPRQAGGSRREDTNTASNGLFLCGFGGCHDWVESHRAESYKLGLLLKQHQNPLTSPVLLKRYGGWVFLNDDGQVVRTNGEVA